MSRISRTINPLHFEDLEPHRFEDLVRQLLYDFKIWRSLEATGRQGSDDGFDARGVERADSEADVPEVEGAEDSMLSQEGERLWLIQCKRERNIGPTRLSGLIKELGPQLKEKTQGLIFVAACDFSKKSFDEFRKSARELGLDEAHLWGKAALEDMLFQPKNDHLLFAYFGFSLAIRRRTKKTELRSVTTTKRKLKRIIDKAHGRDVVVRDALDTNYPYLLEEADKPIADRRHRWRLYSIDKMTHRGLGLVFRKHFAYFHSNGQWDMADAYNDADLGHIDPWNRTDPIESEIRSEIYECWNKIDPPSAQAWLTVFIFVKFEDILEVDEIGDEITDLPHIFVNWKHDCQYPTEDCTAVIETIIPYERRQGINPKSSKRVSYFPPHLRKCITSSESDPATEAAGPRC